MKYVIVKDRGCEMPVMFPDPMVHKTFKNLVPIAAGMYEVYTATIHREMSGHCGEPVLKVRVWGKSVSLDGLKSRPEDADIIKHALEFEG